MNKKRICTRGEEMTYWSNGKKIYYKGPTESICKKLCFDDKLCESMHYSASTKVCTYYKGIELGVERGTRDDICWSKNRRNLYLFMDTIFKKLRHVLCDAILTVLNILLV